MSTATARVRPQQHAPKATPELVQLRVIETVKAGTSPAKLLLILVIPVILIVLANLYINTQMAQTAYELREKQVELIRLTEKNEALEQQLQVVSSPATLEENAKRLGMVPAPDALFISIKKNSIQKNLSDF
ncbi:hypothetical protein HMPREF0044_0495 [Gleimia coleocanis DSM 15436]|uniref:Cell division protein FtsL n=1 Tax=Gleimia coleocanis DSM 15436 TaxID=525245 RepID=C0VZA5_9ACTO|nr:hypothetical protein [Gleimia coleocanis]EEH64206.1 hypothetical protein HMPREF0044_0495 [Gleimia coleocanis DSM 15436]